MKPRAIVLDIDGVVLNSEFIMQEAVRQGLEGSAKWNYFYENCNSDEVELMPYIKEFLSELCCDTPIIISTGRNEKCRVETVGKLAKHKIIFDRMYMRADKDFRESYQVKHDHLVEIMKSYDVICFIDDELANCNIAKKLGIMALRRV